MVSNIIDTESTHLKGIKMRLSNIYEDYIVLTKDVKIIPHKPSKTTA